MSLEFNLGYSMEAVPAHPTELYEILESSKEERRELTLLLISIESKSRTIFDEPDTSCQLQLLRQFREEVLPFSAKLSRYMVRQDRIVYPFLNQYFNMSADPLKLLTFWRLVKDQELAEEYLEFFTDAIDVLTYPTDNAEICLLFAHFLQACELMKGFLQEEEQLVTPLTEEIVTDIDYLFS